VRKFYLPELGIGIEDYPRNFVDLLSEPQSDEQEKQNIRESPC